MPKLENVPNHKAKIIIEIALVDIFKQRVYSFKGFSVVVLKQFQTAGYVVF